MGEHIETGRRTGRRRRTARLFLAICLVGLLAAGGLYFWLGPANPTEQTVQAASPALVQPDSAPLSTPMAELPPAPELPQPAAIPVAPDLAPFAAPTPGETAQAPAPISGKLDVPVPEPDAGGRLAVPVAGMGREDLSDTYNDMRGSVRHEALDVMAPTGTPVVAVDDGVIRKQFISKKGGLTLYQFDSQEKLCYYYAHLDRYADGMAEGKQVRRGEVIGYVGTSGNAKSPHLHFSVTRLGLDKKWWQGEPINPYPLIMGGR